MSQGNIANQMKFDESNTKIYVFVLQKYLCLFNIIWYQVTNSISKKRERERKKKENLEALYVRILMKTEYYIFFVKYLKGYLLIQIIFFIFSV